MADTTRALEILKYLQDGGYSLQDLIDVIEEIDDIDQSQAGETIKASAGQKKAKDILLNRRISNMLQELGVPNFKGYKLLVEAITEVYFDETFIGRMTTELYPKLAKKHQVVWRTVERNIRTCIEVAFGRMPFEVMEKYFGNKIHPEKGKATNGEFIAGLAERLHLEEE